MTDNAPLRLTLRQRWHRLRTSPRFPFLLFFGLLVAGGLSQVYCYWWGVRIQRMVASHRGSVSRKPFYPYSLKRAVGARFIEPLEPINGVSLSPESSLPASDIALLEGLWSLSGLGLQGPIASDGWQQVGRLHGLRGVDLSGFELVVREPDFEQLARLPKLTSLYLRGVTIEPRGLRHFASHSSLTRLHIDSVMAVEQSAVAERPAGHAGLPSFHVKFDVASLREFAAQRTLSELTLFGCDGFGDEHLLALTSALPDGTEPLPSLTMLNLFQTGVTCSGVRFLGNLPRLEHLCLAGIPLGDDGLRGLKHNSTIRNLNVSLTQIGDRDVETLLTMTNLKSVRMAYVNITEQGLMRLTTHPKLRGLLVGTDVPEATVIALRNHLACHVVK